MRRIGRAAKRSGVAWCLAREGSRHSIFVLGAVTIPIPRHAEIGEGLAVDIFKECESELGSRWWK